MKYVKVKTILSGNELNFYKGCSCGCIYCEEKAKCRNKEILVKENALELLESQLKKKKPCMIKIGTITDPYQSIEQELCLTKGALELILKYKFGAVIYTKNALILRDLDLIEKINNQTKAIVIISFTSYQDIMTNMLEPLTSLAKERCEILSLCKKKNIPTIMQIEPILPYITDTRRNLEGLLKDAVNASCKGIICNGMGFCLNSSNKGYFYKNLVKSFPGIKEKYDMVYKNTELCQSLQNYELMTYFDLICNDKKMENDVIKLNDYINNLEEKQLSIFDFMPENEKK